MERMDAEQLKVEQVAWEAELSDAEEWSVHRGDPKNERKTYVSGDFDEVHITLYLTRL